MFGANEVPSAPSAWALSGAAADRSVLGASGGIGGTVAALGGCPGTALGGCGDSGTLYCGGGQGGGGQSLPPRWKSWPWAVVADSPKLTPAQNAQSRSRCTK